MENSSDLH